MAEFELLARRQPHRARGAIAARRRPAFSNRAVAANLNGSAVVDKALLPLLSGAGNSAVARHIQRAPGGKKPPQRDVKSMTDKEIQAEIDSIYARILKGVKGKEWQDAYTREQQLQDEVERRRLEAVVRDFVPNGHKQAQALAAEAESAARELQEFVSFANETLEYGQQRISAYLGYYAEAYAGFSGALATARKDAERREAMWNAVSSIVVGAGLGLAGGAIFAAAKGAGKLIVEVGTEIAELVTASRVNDSITDGFTPPPGLDPALQAAAGWERMSDAWRGVAMFNQTLLGFGDYRVAVAKLAGDLGAWATGGSAPMPAEKLIMETGQLRAGKYVARLREQVALARQGVGDFSAGLRHPLLRRLANEIEQDLWIKWISQIKTNWGYPYDNKVHDLLDEDAVEARLNKIGLIGEYSRLGVDFGWNTTPGDTSDAHRAAVIAQQRNEQLGRIGVAVTAVGTRKGVVHIGRYGTYWRDGKQVEYPTLPEGYFRATQWSDPSVPGQIVRVEGTDRDGLEVEPVDGTEVGGILPEEERLAKTAR